MGKEKINPLLNHFEVIFEKKYSQDREMINKKKNKNIFKNFKRYFIYLLR